MNVSIYTVDQRIYPLPGKPTYPRDPNVYPCRIDLHEDLVDFIRYHAITSLWGVLRSDHERVTHKEITNWPTPIRDEYRGGATLSIGLVPKFFTDSSIPQPCLLKIRVVNNDTMYHDDEPHLPYLVDVGYHDTANPILPWVSVLRDGYLSEYFEYIDRQREKGTPALDTAGFVAWEFAYQFLMPQPGKEYEAWNLVKPEHAVSMVGPLATLTHEWLSDFEYSEKGDLRRGQRKFPVVKDHVQALFDVCWKDAYQLPPEETFAKITELTRQQLARGPEGLVNYEAMFAHGKERI